MRLDQQRPDTLGSANLVAAHRHHIGSRRSKIEGQLAKGLHGINKKRVTGGTDQSIDARDVLHHAGLVIDPVQGDQQVALGLCDHIGQLIEINAAVGQKPDSDDRQARGFGSLGHRRMFAGADDHGACRKGLGPANDGLGDGLGGRTGEDDLLALGARKGRHLRAGRIDEIAQCTAMAVYR
jgi:hypothetical protein